MSNSSRRFRSPVLPPTRPASRLKPLSGGRVASSVRQPQRSSAAARRRHSPQELGLLFLCASAVVLVAGLTAFTIWRDEKGLRLTEPLVTPALQP